MSPLYKQFRATIKRHKFILPGEKVLAAVSGGVDSMVLAQLLVQLKKDIDFKLSLVHVNYCMRGVESDEQEKLVQAFAKKNKLDCFVTKANLSPKSADNFQAMARDFRYHYFQETALQIGAKKIAVAHHLEDQVETILAQLLRGSSVRGLGGMRKRRGLGTNIQLIRPLLAVSKEDLKKYAAENQISTIEDSSNSSDKYWRNRIRHELLPIIQDLRPRSFQKITKLGLEIQELTDFLEMAAKDWLKNYGRQTPEGFWLPRPGWLKLPRTLRLEVLHQAMLESAGSAKNLKRDHFERCEQLSLGLKEKGYYNLSHGRRFIRSADDLLISNFECVSFKV